MELFNTPPSEPILILLTIAYALWAAITTFDIRINQGIKYRMLHPNHRLPNWVGVFGWLLWLTWLAIFLLNWWYALALFALKFIFKVVPILEYLGALLLLPIFGKKLTVDSIKLFNKAARVRRVTGGKFPDIEP